MHRSRQFGLPVVGLTPHVSSVGMKLASGLKQGLRSRPSVKIALVRGATLPVTAASALLTARLITENYSQEVFGVATLIWGLTAFFPIADLGIGAALTSAVARSSDAMRDQTVQRELASAAWVTVRTAFGAIALCGGLAGMGLFGRLFSSSDQYLHMDAAVVLFVAIAALNIPLSLVHRYLLGAGHQTLSIAATAAGAALTPAIVLGLSASAAPAWTLSVAPGLGLLSINLATVYTAIRRRILPRPDWFRLLAEGRFVRRTTDASAGSWSMFVITSVQALSIQSDRVLIGIASTPYELARYAFAAILYAPLLSILTTSAAALWPIYARLREGEAFSRRYVLRQGTPVYALALVLAVALVAMSLPVGHLLGGRDVLDLPIAIAFGTLLVVQGFTLPMAMYFTDPSGLRTQARWVTAMGTVNVAGSILTISSLGAVGPVIASALSILLLQGLPLLRALGAERKRATGKRL